MSHTFRSGDYMTAGGNAEVSCQESHGCSCRTYIYNVRHLLKGTEHNVRIIGIGQVEGQIPIACKGIYKQGSVADAFAGRKYYPPLYMVAF